MTQATDTPPATVLVEQRVMDDFRAALAAMPFGQDRLAKGQQFNAYESAANDDDDDPADWEYYLSLGPITDSAHITIIEGEWRAKLIETALRVALNASREATLTRAPDGLAAELRALAAKATPGPWLVNPFCAQIDVPGQDAPICQMLWPTDLRSEAETEANARLIVALRNNLPAILAALGGPK